MGGTIAEEREALQAELERLESLLALNANWQALRLLKGRTSALSAMDPETAAEQAKLESALEHNPVFRQRKLIVEALATIGALSPKTGLTDFDAEPVANLPEAPFTAPQRAILAGTEAAPTGATAAGSSVTDEGFAALEPSPSPSSVPPSLEPAEASTEAAPVRERKRAGRRAATTRRGPKPGSLLSRLRQVRPQAQFDSAGYAAYRSEIEEATVEIIRRDKGRD
ncbi:MAG TPA: hypothetical protein VNK52_09775 [Hyphomicrobiaceae bacterium]|nr:hypothetical protein [Hyphomicrobiaceae bacterium]